MHRNVYGVKCIFFSTKDIKKIPITLSLCTNIIIISDTSRDIKDVHKEKERRKKDPTTVSNPSQQPEPNHQYNTQDYRIGSPKAMPSRTKTVHKRHHHSIEDCRFSSRRKYELSRQCLQQGTVTYIE
jgi:hypothetical protein